MPRPPGVEPRRRRSALGLKLQLSGAVHVARNAQFLKMTNLSPKFDRVAADVARPVIHKGVLLLGHVERAVAMIGAVVAGAKSRQFHRSCRQRRRSRSVKRHPIPAPRCSSPPIQGSSSAELCRRTWLLRRHSGSRRIERRSPAWETRRDRCQLPGCGCRPFRCLPNRPRQNRCRPAAPNAAGEL